MQKQIDSNIIQFPAEYLLEQRKLDRWMTIAACSVVMGSDEPMASVQMILDQFGDTPDWKRTPADIIAHARFAVRTLPPATDDDQEFATAVTENVFNEWIDAWLLPSTAC